MTQNEPPSPLLLVIIEGTRFPSLRMFLIFEESSPLDGILHDKHIYSNRVFMDVVVANSGHSKVHSKIVILFLLALAQEKQT